MHAAVPQVRFEPSLQNFCDAATYVYLAPDTSLGAAMLAGIPLTFALCAVHCPAVHHAVMSREGIKSFRGQCRRDMADLLSVFVDGGKGC
jgi:hypothetical protein